MINKTIMEEIQELYHYFFQTDNYYQKSYIMFVFYTLKQEFPNNQLVNQMFEDINNKIYLLYENLQREEARVQEYIRDNKTFFDEQIIMPTKYHPCLSRNITNYVLDYLEYLFNAFLKKMDNNLYLFGKQMREEKRILFGKSNHTMHTSINSSKTIIFIQKMETVYDVLVLLHELGHAYDIYLNNRVIDTREDMDQKFKDEILPMIMEQKFIRFLYDNHLDNEALICQNEFDILMNICYRKKMILCF